MSVADWRKTKPPQRTLLEMLRSCPVDLTGLDLTGLDLTRSREIPRDLAL